MELAVPLPRVGVSLTEGGLHRGATLPRLGSPQFHAASTPTPVADALPPMTTHDSSSPNLLGILLRLAFPCAILAAGWFGYQQLMGYEEPAPEPEAEKPLLRTRVEDMPVIDYQVIIETHAVVQPHNQVSLAAQVAGTVINVSPSFEVGAFFTKGELLVEIDPRDYQTALAMAESQLTSARSERKLAQVVEDRKLRLIESNAVSQGEVDAAVATREQAEANVDLATSQVEQAKLALERTKVFAPFDGRVMTKLIGLGQMAGANNPIGEVFAIDFVEVRLPISGHQRQFLHLPEFADDTPLIVTLRDGIREANNSVWRGQIVRTEGVLDPDSRDVFAIARIEDPFGRHTDRTPLRIGQPVVASIEGITLDNVIALPRGAVRQLDQVVLVDRADQTLLPIEIESIWSDAQHVVVPASMIPKGKWLSTTALAYTPEGAKVEIIPDAKSESSIAESHSAESKKKATN